MARRPRHRHESATAPVPTTAGAVAAPAQTRLLLFAGLAALVLFVYAQVRAHQFLNYDDDIYVTANPYVMQGLSGDSIRWAFTSYETNWHPVTWLSHMLDVTLFGLRPSAHLFVNVALHLANAILVLLLLWRLTAKLGRSAIVAALFAVHPLHVESVAWVSERKDVLSSLFMLLTLHAYVSFAKTRSRKHYALAMLAFAFGLMSKGMLVTLPFVLLLLDSWPLQRFELRDGKTLGRLFVEKLPFFALLIPSVAITYLAQQRGGAIAARPLASRVANAIVSYGAYLWKTIWPTDLAIPYPWRTSVEPLHIGLSLLALVAISVAAFVLARDKRYLFTGWFWFAGMLVPVIGLVQIGSQSMADRYTYLPHIGLFVAIVWLVADALPRDARRGAGIVAAIAIVALAVVARAQVARWRDSVTLFAHATSVTARNSIAHTNLGSALQDAGDMNGAIQQLTAAVAADPSSSDALVKLARLELQNGQNDAAIGHLQRAASLQSTPETLALLATARGDTNDAIARYAAAVAADPDAASLRNDYAAALARAERNDEALTQYREALRISPNLYDARMNYGALLSRLDRNNDARQEFTAAAQLRPASPEPHVYLALINASSGHVELAIGDVQRALAINPVEANMRFTNAVRMAYKDTNLQEYLAFLQSQPR